MTRPSHLGAEDFCYLTTIGRKTGESHEIEIWFGSDPAHSVIYVMAGAGVKSDWVANLVAEPHVTLRIANTSWRAIAHVVEDPMEDALARRLVGHKYVSRGVLTADDEWNTTALPVAIEINPRDDNGLRES
jgi:deazaflavin-dependent oxidoreductase (nitroreductase family)